MPYLIGLDMGGTEIKAAAIPNKGMPVCKPLSFPSYAGRSKAEIIQHIGSIISKLAKETGPPAAIGFSFPGPFDYDAGVSFIKGLDKYESLYGRNIAHLFRADASVMYEVPFVSSTPMFFINDVTAFAMGVAASGIHTEKALCVCIGTGCGSAFLVDGKVVTDGHAGIPENGWIYPLPFKDSNLDDHLSKRGLEKITAKAIGKPIDGKTLATMANEQKAMDCFTQFGSNIAEGLAPILEEFNPTTLILGGQIMKSFLHFSAPIKEACDKKKIKLHVCPNTSQLALAGLWAEAKRRGIF